MRPNAPALLALTAFVMSLPGIAAAADPISVKVNMARVLRISAPAATVIIGNPGVADVVIQDPQTLVLTGRTFGQTNLIVLDATGEPVADTLIEVVQEQADIVTVFSGGARTTFSCAADCAPTVTIGDATVFTDEMVRSLDLVQTSQAPAQ